MIDPTSRRIALFVVNLASFLTAFVGSSVNVALPAISAEYKLDAVTLGWIAMSFSLATAVTLLPLGRLADIHGRKRVFLLGMVVFGASCLLIPLAPTAPVLIGLRVVQGIGGAMLFGTSVAILTSVYPASEKGRVLGLNVATVYIGLSVGPTAGGLLTAQFGWRSIFLAIVPLALIILLLAVWKLKGEWAEARGERFDVGGAIIYGLSLLAVIYGLSLLPALAGAVLIPAGILGLVLFAVWERRSTSPLLDIRIFASNQAYAFSNLAALINYCASSATGFFLSLYLQQIRGLPPQKAGLILIAQPIVQALLSPLAGRLSDSVEPRTLASLGMACTAAGLLLFGFLSPATPFVVIVLILMLSGAGFALFSSPNTNAIMSSVQKRFYGVASATLSTMRVVGQTLSMGIAVLIFALVIGRVEITPQYYPQLMTSIRIAFGIFAVLCVFGIFASLARGNVRQG